MPHEFFNDESTAPQRLDVANQALEDLIVWLKTGGGQVGIYDASNTESSRRSYIYDRLQEANVQVSCNCDRFSCIKELCRISSLMCLGFIYWGDLR